MRASERLRAGVIGLGHLGRYHAQKYSALPDVELVTLYDSDRRRAAAVASELRCEVAEDADDLVSRVDLASIAVPTAFHLAVGLQALRSGVHVLMEKPLAASVDEGRRIVEAADTAGVVLQVGHLERFNPVFKDIRRVIGRPRFMECHRLAPFAGRGSDTDVVFDVMIHDLDLIDYLVGASLERVEAVGVPVLSDKIDIANARLIFDGGCTANVTASRVSLKRERKMRVFQEDAYVSIDFDSGKALVARKSRRRGAAEVGNPMDAIEAEEKELGGGDPLMEQLAAFVSCVRGGSRPLIGGPEGLRALALADRVVKAIPDFGPGG